MTEKRFYMDKSGDLYDRENKTVMVDFGYSYDGVGCKRIIDLLNELAEENKALKKQLQSEHQQLENAILLERTRMGKNCLKQFRDAIQ
jgi:thiol-disulfide isomerase/thioredoxin